MSSNVFGVSFDAHDAHAAASFWAAALGRTVAEGADSDNAVLDADPAIPGSRISFHQVPESKTVKNRMHFDLITTDFDAEIEPADRPRRHQAQRDQRPAPTGSPSPTPRATSSTSSRARRPTRPSRAGGAAQVRPGQHAPDDRHRREVAKVK